MSSSSPRDEVGCDLQRLIGFATRLRELESWYAFISRLIRANHLSDGEIDLHFPSQWLWWAFHPHSVQPEDVASCKFHPSDLSNLDLKLRAYAWQPFRSLSSSPPERLRGCPTCLKFGYHTYAYQGDMIAKCPVHGDNLVHRCPYCDTPLLWLVREPARSAMQCPSGCSLQQGVHSGLHVPYEDEMAAALGRHLVWIEKIKSSFSFESGPIHIAYPPYTFISPLGDPSFPTKGLLAALLNALATKVALPEGEDFHEKSGGLWKLRIEPWKAASAKQLKKHHLDSCRASFRRGAYRTIVPLTNPEKFDSWLKANDEMYGSWHEGIVEQGTQYSNFAFPSFLVTNGEIDALKRILDHGDTTSLACDHYHAVLIELLDDARLRRASLDNLQPASPKTDIAERFDSIVDTKSGLWRIAGYTRGGGESSLSWRDFREPAELGAGVIHVMRRNGPW